MRKGIGAFLFVLVVALMFGGIMLGNLGLIWIASSIILAGLAFIPIRLLFAAYKKEGSKGLSKIIAGLFIGLLVGFKFSVILGGSLHKAFRGNEGFISPIPLGWIILICSLAVCTFIMSFFVKNKKVEEMPTPASN